MKAIYKYTLLKDGMTPLASGIYTDEEITVEMPMGAMGVKLAPQYNDLVVWALVNTDPTTPKAKAAYRIVGTGHDLPDDWASKWMYVQTLFTGPFVWHVWEKIT